MKRYSVLLLLFLSFSLFSQTYGDFELKIRQDSVGFYLLAKNNLPCSTTFKLSDISKNRVIKKLIINSLDSAIVLRNKSTSKDLFLKVYEKQYTASYSYGDSISSKPDTTYLYSLPFAKRKRYKVIQSWGGKFSHSSLQSYHAIDFKMSIGQPLYAAREGIVVSSVEKYTKNGGKELIDFANKIVILHKDGTFAYYVHLKPNGSEVTVGQKVNKGELIGYSGNTGFSSQPHLHFVVRDGYGNSIPIYFQNLSQKKLSTRKYYRN